MKAQVWALIMVLTLAGVRLAAQEATPAVEYRLRVPTAEEYISAISAIWENRDEFSFSTEQIDFDARLGRLFIDEFRQQYFDAADAATLSDAYEQLNRGFYLPFNYVPFLDVVSWNMVIVRRQLAANPTEFPDNGVLIFDRYYIDIERHDFDSDGDYEWLMYVRREDQTSHFTDYWIAKRNPNSESGYDFTKVPVPFTDTNFWPAQENSEWAGLRTPDFRDVNADGIVEWITSTSTVEPSSNAQGEWHTFYVLGWRNNQWSIITAQTVENENGEAEIRTLPPRTHVDYVDASSPGWTFENIDQDEALELIQYQEHTDERFDCKHIEQSVYDWDGEYYMLSQYSNQLTSSFGCVYRLIFDFLLNTRWQLQQFGNLIRSQVALQPTATSDPMWTAHGDLTRAFNRVQSTWSNSDIPLPVNEIEAILNDPRYPNLSNSYLIPLSRYYYALVLESRNRPDEALAEYIAIYEAAPESAWGMLAALHLERVE